MARKPAPGTRERILAVASRLFSIHGVHAVGLQQIIDEAGCGKNLLYREFAGKDELVVACLHRYRENWMSTIEEAGRSAGGDPAGHLVAIVGTLAAVTSSADYPGCPVHKAYAEFPEAGHPIRQASTEHFEATRAVLHDLAARAGAPEPGVLASRIMLIIHGLSTNPAALGAPAVPAAVAFAEDLVRDALRPSTPARTHAAGRAG
ncbi:TetR/AcrR family transcriptional regulator [Nonomuraea turcica]|uniref:TetR/AcrR family transcriptional regulator n=1 Tax=Nonomuraea sp. G32 TaxID=3067274 RepID=UPI00273BC193|nr:TetR/AcrR family transcriptional regulator [Nonomuraea sp. G32]MDP4504166.1 TetR/AcrR family transcriptional regulator [Nonomuraea sp. G32]